VTSVSWDLAEVEVAASLEPGSSRSRRGLAAEGLVERVGRGRWQITRAGQRLSVADRGLPISRKNAENALPSGAGRTSEPRRSLFGKN
jgi:hypothetical protein